MIGDVETHPTLVWKMNAKQFDEKTVATAPDRFSLGWTRVEPLIQRSLAQHSTLNTQHWTLTS